jgi:hypothetical protein
MVDQTGVSWNPLLTWLELIDGTRGESDPVVCEIQRLASTRYSGIPEKLSRSATPSTIESK